MAEVQEQRYICKICSKSCVSGKSLGGHMRVHLAVISASKKAAQEKAEIKMEFEGGGDDQENRSNSDLQSEVKITDLGDGDQGNNYELRENPKKSWRISNPKHGLISVTNSASCKECGKEFPSLRALSGHMRSHSIKNKEVHQCKNCGKGFDSIRAMFGHMKSHSKKSKIPDNSADSLSDLENLCPVRRKRSRIRYKSTPTSNPSCPSLNASTSTVSELDEVEEIATCLIMLSRGVREWIKTDSIMQSSDDDSVYFGAESSSCKSKKFDGDDGDFECIAGEKIKMSSVNTCTEENVSEFDVLDSGVAAEDEMKVDLEVSDIDELLNVENQAMVDEFGVKKLVEFEELNKVAVQLDHADDSCKKENSSVHKTSSEKDNFENEANDTEMLKDFVKKRRKCNKISLSHDMLESHKTQGNSSEVDDHMNTSLLSVIEADSKLDHLEYGDSTSVSLESSKNKVHECPICFKVFHSGQALGGHKRAHYTEIKTKEAMVVNQEVAQVHDLFDLNFPITADEGTKSDGLSLWEWVERGHEHEALVLSN